MRGEHFFRVVVLEHHFSHQIERTGRILALADSFMIKSILYGKANWKCSQHSVTSRVYIGSTFRSGDDPVLSGEMYLFLSSLVGDFIT